MFQSRGYLLSVTSLIPLVLYSAHAAAQTTVDRAHVGVSYARGTRIGDRGAKLQDTKQIDARLPLPAAFLGETILAPSLGYEARFQGLEADGAATTLSESDRERTFHRFQLGMTVIRKLTPAWLLTTGISSTLATDFEQRMSFGRDTSWAGFVFANHFIGGDPQVAFTCGLVGVYPYEGIPIYPLAGFQYRKGPYVLDLMVPRMAALLKPSDGVELGLVGSFDRYVYRTGLPSEAQSLGARYIRETSLRAGVAANVKLGASDLWLSSTVGLDFLNDYELLDGDRERVSNHPDVATGPTPFVRLVLGWRPPRRAPPTQKTASRAMDDHVGRVLTRNLPGDAVPERAQIEAVKQRFARAE
jgi:hypothetical protein